MNKLIAHRGLQINNYKENSYEAIKEACMNNSYYGFECDIRTTLDNVFVLSHNALYGNELVSKTNYSVLKDMGITKLEDVLKIDTNKIMLLEIKEVNIDIDRLNTLLNKYRDKNIYLTSFYPKVIKKFLKFYKRSYKLGVLNAVFNSEEDYDDYDFICLLKSVYTTNLYNYFTQKKMEIFLYGIVLNKTKMFYEDVYLIN